MQHILIADDNPDITDVLAAYAKKEDLVPVIAADGEEAIRMFRQYNPAVVLLDVMMPKEDGYEVCRKIRAKSDVPVILITARGEDFEKIMGLDIGADDYIEKPYDIDILIAKIKGIFKRRYHRDILSADGVTLNLVDKTAVIDGKPIELPAKEFDLLALLIENQGKALKKEYLFGTVWGSDSDSELQTLHVHINRLRQKLGDDPKNAKRLLTVWGVGYKFV